MVLALVCVFIVRDGCCGENLFGQQLVTCCSVL